MKLQLITSLMGVLCAAILQAGEAPELQIGWAKADLTPKKPVLIAGQIFNRISEGVSSPIEAVACALSSGEEQVVFVMLDHVTIPKEFRRAIDKRLAHELPGVKPESVIVHATHTHTGPETRLDYMVPTGLSVQPVEEYVEEAAEGVVAAIKGALAARKPGAVSFGMDEAVIGRNRRWINANGEAIMYRLSGENLKAFSHIEGYEDHSLQLLATYSAEGALTGVMINIACPTQNRPLEFTLSADFWHEARLELAKRLGPEVFIMSQVSVAGDQSGVVIWGRDAHARMLKLHGRTAQDETALRIADAVERILPVIAPTREAHPVLHHETAMVEVPKNVVTDAQLAEAKEALKVQTLRYEEESRKLEADPKLKEQARWYVPLSDAAGRQRSQRRVIERYEEQQKGITTEELELHVVRLGEVAFATNPVELYLDHGMKIKVQSPFIQTFLIQLAGDGSYISSKRSLQYGGYGSSPSTNRVGAEGGEKIVQETLRMLNRSLSQEGGKERGLDQHH